MAKLKRSTKDAGWFTRGAEAAEAARKQAQRSFRPELWMKDGEVAEAIFLDKESFNVSQHSIKLRGRFRKYTCLNRNCPLCKVDDPRVTSVYRVIDLRRFKDKKTGKVGPYKEKYYEAGARIQTTIAKLLSKKQLYKKVCEISRDGAGTNTTYTVIPIGPIGEKLRAKLVRNGLLKPQLDFVEDFAPKDREDLEEIAALLWGSKDSYGDDDDEPAAARPNRRNYLDDDDDDDDYDDDDDDDSDDDDDDDDDA